MAQAKPTKHKRKPVPSEAQETFITDFVEATKGKSDLVKALVTTAYLEGALITLLSNSFVKCETAEGLFSAGGAKPDYEQMKHLAAAALSEAKNTGRNRCIIYRMPNLPFEAAG